MTPAQKKLTATPASNMVAVVAPRVMCVRLYTSVIASIAPPNALRDDAATPKIVNEIPSRTPGTLSRLTPTRWASRG